MHDAIGRIMQLRDDLKERYHYAAFTVPRPTLNLGAIHGGDASNRICACCELHMDIRPLPGMTLNDLNGLLNEALAPVSERWHGRLTVSELHPPIPGYECPPDHKLVEVVKNSSARKPMWSTTVPKRRLFRPSAQRWCWAGLYQPSPPAG